ncbi:Carotenoid biosynthesis protein [uncultured archaeon]|nr:Carotenoid biosynthesis protein [uncultured archaeon]
MFVFFLEIASLILFLGCLYHARKSGKNVVLLLSAVIYAILFENFNILLSAGKTGGYFYSSQFNFFIFNTPVFIILCWAFLIYSAYQLVNKLKVKDWKKPFAAAVLVTLVDFVVDPIATKLNLWFWTGYTSTDGFFGIPGNNFLGWLLVTFFFLFIFTKIDESKTKWKNLSYLVTPFLAYVGFIFAFTTISSIQYVFKFSKLEELIFFFVIYAYFAFVSFRKH